MVGITYTEITLLNAGDVGNAKRGIIKASAIRKTSVRALVDTGAATLVINEAMRQKLGLGIESVGDVTLADGGTEECQFTEPVKVCWKNRSTSCEAMVMVHGDEVLLGAIPMEAMDLTVNPARQEVTGAHGDRVLLLAK
ncbi:retroviral-like aspartic protease family protein [Treponema primitia]|uniref:retroviral-like aspartic protease family protein n=1 Tax=Treponema primitia TaxID=88058 RepID=UPI0004752035|nr:retroviral-like aspartic protease family protein [Treponema primitia]